jgi:hypothetical protein
MIFEKYKEGDLSTEPEICTLQTFQELKTNITEAVELGYSVKL